MCRRGVVVGDNGEGFELVDLWQRLQGGRRKQSGNLYVA